MKILTSLKKLNGTKAEASTPTTSPRAAKRSRSLGGCLMGLSALAFFSGSAAMAVPAHSILYYADYAIGTDQMAAALAGLPAQFSVTTATSDADFKAKLQGGGYQMGVLAIQNSYSSGYVSPGALDTFAVGGGKAIYIDWSANNTFASAFNASYSGTKNNTALTITDATYAAALEASLLMLTNTGWGTFSTGLTALTGGTSLAMFGDGSSAVVVGNNGNTIVNGFLTDTVASSKLFALEILGLFGELITSTTGYWLGTTNGQWTANNWASDAAGTATSLKPMALTDVVFSATGARNQTTTLGADITINSLTISDTASVTIGGTNTLTVSGTTGITVNAGAGAATIDSGLVLSGSSQTITVDNAAGLAVNGKISGSIGLIKSGAGTLTIAGANTYTGLTTVADGALVINGSIASDVFVWGGVLGGSGQIGGSVLNQSVVSPGNSPGTLTIAGDYDQAASGFLLIQIASPTVYDRLVVGGQAHLDGTLIVDLYNGFTLKRGQTFSFLNAAGGVTGEFAQAFVNTNTLLSLGITYLSDSVVLETVQGSFAQDVPGLTPNELAVAKALDKVVDKRRVSGLVDELDALPLGAVPSALEKIVPTQLLAMFDASIASATVQADNLERRLEEVRNGSTVSTSGLHLSDPRGTRSGGGDDGKQAIGKDGKELEPAPLSNRWGYFVNGSGEFVDTESTAVAQGNEFTTGGISAGADYRLCDRAVVGVTAGYANTATDSRNQDSVKINSGKLGLYGTVFDQGFFLNGGVGGGVNSYDTKRETIGGNALGDAEGNDFNALLGTGYTYRTGGWSFGPIASLRYSWVGIDGFTEHGSLAPLRYDDQSEDSLRSTAGLQAAYAFNLCKVLVTPRVRAQWQHEYLENSRSIGASFLPGGSFSAFGPEIGRDSLLLDAGVTVQLTSQVGVYACYTGDLGRDDYSAQSVNGGVQVSF